MLSSRRNDPLQQEMKYALHYKPKILQAYKRNYSSSKLIKTNYFDLESSSKNLGQNQKYFEQILPNIENHDHKSNQPSRFKMVNQKERHEVIRKNASLKLLKREEGFKIYNKSRVQEIKNGDTLVLNKEEKASNQSQSLQSIPAKKSLLKKTHNRLTIERKYKNIEKQAQKSDVSFEDCLQKFHNEEEKVPNTLKICSQNLLGNEFRRYSCVKIKALVTNPFEKLIKHEEELKEQRSHQISQLQAEQFKQSQIFNKQDQSCPSVAQEQQIKELLNMF